MELLHTFIESSIAVLAFSAIVAEFRKRSTKGWNVRLYQGIISHTLQAFVYSCLPLLALQFISDERQLWMWCGGFLGLFTFAQGVMVLFVDQSSSIKIRIMMLCLSTLVFLLQLAYIFNLIESGIGVYLIGVFWHLFQSLVIVCMFIIDTDIDE
jgi:hypothetical protein